jgi:hypothetical protein
MFTTMDDQDFDQLLRSDRRAVDAWGGAIREPA